RGAAVAPAVPKVVADAAEHLRTGRIHEMGTLLGGASAADAAEFDKHLDRTGLRRRFTAITKGIPSGKGSGMVSFRNATNQWTDPEVAQVESAFRRVPADHRAGLKGVHRWRRAVAPVGTLDTEGGESFTGTGKMRIYDRGVTGSFGSPLPGSSLAGHDTTLPAGTPGGPVSSLEYTATHELGHFVAASKAPAYSAFKTAAGYREVSQLALPGHLSQYPGAAADLIAKGPKFTADLGEYTYRKHPDIPGHYLGTRKGAVPGSANSAVDPLNAYAHTKPGEHFAELYAQMVHAPEMTHDAYVAQPAAAVKTAQQALDAHDQARAQRSGLGKLWNYRADSNARAVLQGGLAEAQAQQAVRAGAHRVMREDVFGVTPAVVAAKRHTLQGRGQTLARRRAHFDSRVHAASTPQQLDELHRQAMRVR
ncbi:MAG TPA: hypothetical protein VK358_05805, partial [Longimicrobium sp.]|nr:hypothetical protein [Longimicrobium sp.]